MIGTLLPLALVVGLSPLPILPAVILVLSPARARGRAYLAAWLVALTLVVVGAQDQITPPALASEMATGIAGARLVEIPGSGHLATLEAPEAVTAALLDWLAAAGL